jgi:FKBP-type peptidyl-prolyl cis-trans isomerase FkpA
MARRFPVGIRIKELRPGTGEIAAKGRIALVHFDCFLPRGDRISTSRARPFPAQFHIGQRDIVPAIDYGVGGMAVGGLRMVRVSPQLTYNERKTLPNLPENVALRYELELVGLSDAWDPSIYGDWFSTPKDPA